MPGHPPRILAAQPSQSLAQSDFLHLVHRLRNPELCPRCGTWLHTPEQDAQCQRYIFPQQVIC